jgi:hypothetical protein
MRTNAVRFLVLSLLLVLPASNHAQSPNAGFKPTAVTQPLVRKSADAITAAQLKDYLSFVASDAMEGRSTPSRGLDTTALFIGTLLDRWGVKPAGDGGTYFQRIVLQRQKVAPEGTEAVLGARTFQYGKDFLAGGAAGAASGPLIFGGDGWFIKAKNIDAYKGIDPAGKIVVLTAGGLPQGVTVKDLMSGTRGEDWIEPMEYAKKKGAVGVVQLVPLLMQADPEQLDALRKRAEEGSYHPERLQPEQAALPAIAVLAKVAQAMFAREKPDAATILMSFPNGTPVKPFALAADKTFSFTVKTTSERADSQNVVATIEGSDPALKNEYVALGAHYDHLGTGNPVNGDTISNGADDDGSGTVALLSIAEALSRAPRHPKRSVLLVWHMGEEMGLWGSRYFTTFPTVPLDKVVAQLNIDMIGRSKPAGDADPRDKDLSGPNEVYVIGSKMMSTELGQLSEGVNDAYLKMSFNYKYDDPKDPERFFYRSDHINYARKNSPVIFYFTGEHADYHQRTDEVSKIDFAKYEKITRTIYGTLWEIGEMPKRPAVDKPLPAEAMRDIF